MDSATRSLVGERAEQSYFWDQIFQGVHKVHFVWKMFEKATVYTNPDNFLKLAAGHSIQWLAGDNFFVKLAAGSVLIATRILECVREQLFLLKEIKKLSETAFDNAHLYKRTPWVKPGDTVFLSPSVTHSFQSFFGAFFRTVARIFGHLVEICKRLFTLSMRMMSAAEAFSFDPQALKEGTQEFFVNLGRCYEALTENRELLVGFLKENKAVIEIVLQSSQSEHTYQKILSNIEDTVATGEKTLRKQGALKDLSRFAFQHMMFGLFQSVNMHRYMPLEWIPPKEPEWMVENHPHPRYPPIDWIQIYHYQRNAKAWFSKEGGKAYAGTSVFFNQL